MHQTQWGPERPLPFSEDDSCVQSGLEGGENETQGDLSLLGGR